VQCAFPPKSQKKKSLCEKKTYFYTTEHTERCSCQRRKNLGCGHAEIEANNNNNNKKVVKKEGRKQKN